MPCWTRTSTHTHIGTLATHLPYLDEIPLDRAVNTVFQQDYAPAHRAHITADFLDHNAVTTSWPPLSPDINPIELVWAAMKRHIAQHRPSSLPALRLAIRIAWRRIVTADFCAKLYAGLHKRINQIILVNGARL